MAELKKCPFCGSEAVQTFNTRFGYQIFCENTHCFMNEIVTQNMGKSEESVIEAWNNRATEADIRASVINEFAEKMKWEIKNSIGISKRVADFTRAVVDMVSEQLKGE